MILKSKVAEHSFKFSRFAAQLVPFAIVALTQGCGTFVNANYIELQSESGVKTFHAPGYCSPASTELQIDLGEGRYIKMSSPNYVELFVPFGTTFQLMSDMLTPVAVSSSQRPNLRLEKFSDIWPPTKLLSPNNPPGGQYFSKISGVSNFNLEELSQPYYLRFPDALINGKLTKLPVISFQNRKLSYYQSSCWK